MLKCQLIIIYEQEKLHAEHDIFYCNLGVGSDATEHGSEQSLGGLLKEISVQNTIKVETDARDG